MLLNKFSKGMIQRIGIAQLLLNDPLLLILDEPMAGLDPMGRKMVSNILLKMKKEGKTVFFSSHILNDAENLCDRIAILVEGKLTTVDSVTHLLSSFQVSPFLLWKTFLLRGHLYESETHFFYCEGNF